jgi:hypothetical protein
MVMPPSVDEVGSDLHEFSDVASPPSHALGFERSGAVDVVVSLSPESDMQVGEHVVAKSGVLTHVHASSPPQSEPCQSLQSVVLADSKCEDIEDFLAPVLQFTEELHELRGDSHVVLPSVF